MISQRAGSHKIGALTASTSVDGLTRPVEGRLEAVLDGHVIGWAWCPEDPALRIAVTVVVDGIEVGGAVADGVRPSLAHAGIGDGAHVFRLALPATLADSGTHAIEVRAGSAGSPLTPSPRFRAGTSRSEDPFAGTAFLPAVRVPSAPSRSGRSRSGLSGRLSPDGWAVLIVAAAVVLGNLLYLTDIVDPNPLGPTSVLTSSVTPGPFPGSSTLDPNIGYTSQALGHRAALDWLHLQPPWWNPYEGTGAPLAGEMQSASLFLPTILDGVGNGQLYEHMLFELIAGIATFYLLRRLELRRWACVAAAVAFALNGTLAWIGSAGANPVPFLPLLLLGLEWAYAATIAGRRGGWWLIAVAGAGSVYAGFPEIAYVDMLLAIAWFGWRCRCAGRDRLRAFVGKAAAGAAAGAMLAAPLVVAFTDYLGHADIGAHLGAISAIRLSSQSLAALVLPYVYGPIFAYQDPHGLLTNIWGNVGGYLTPTLVVFGIIGLTSQGRRGLRLVLGAFLALALGRMYGAPVLGHVLGILPGMSSVDFAEYAFPAVELAATVLLALGLDSIGRASPARRRVMISGGAALAVVAVAAVGARALVAEVSGAGHQWLFFAVSVGWGVAVVGLGTFAVLSGAGRTALRLACALVVVDAIAMFAVPELSAPRAVRTDVAPVAYLRQHLGLARFFTLGPIQPNYGAYFGLASVNDNDLPIPENWSTYVNAHLDPYASPHLFIGTDNGGRPPSAPSPSQELLDNVNGYRAAGVAYVLAEPGTKLPQSPRTLTLVFRSPSTWIYRLAGTAPYFSTSTGNCAITPRSNESVRLSCTGPAVLLRRETYMAGWSARIDGHAVPVREADGLFQAVDVGAGSHQVTFGYAPPGIDWALIAFLLGATWLGAGVLWSRTDLVTFSSWPALRVRVARARRAGGDG